MTWIRGSIRQFGCRWTWEDHTLLPRLLPKRFGVDAEARMKSIVAIVRSQSSYEFCQILHAHGSR